MAEASRLARLARVREVERRRAAERAANSGRDHDRLRVLAQRSHDLAASYADPGDAADGASLVGLFGFRAQIAHLSARAASDANLARLQANEARLALSVAEHKRELAGRRLEDEGRERNRRRDGVELHLARTLNNRSRTRT